MKLAALTDIRNIIYTINQRLAVCTSFIISACLSLIVHVAHPQIGSHQQYDFFDNTDGLSQGTVNCIVQDKFGYMWFGTQDGLNKFDGINFEVYKYNAEDSTSISDNFITAFETDDDGNIWIGTRSGGLNKYNLEKGIFEHYIHDKSNPKSISHNRVSSIVRDSKGNFWIGTYGGGLNYFNTNEQSFTRYTHNNTSNSLINDRVLSLCLDGENKLWIGTEEGLDLLNLTTMQFQHYGTAAPESKVNTLWKHNNEHLYLGTDRGLQRLSVTTGIVENLPILNNYTNTVLDHQVMRIIGSKNENIWIATDGGYLYLYAPPANEFTLYRVAFPRLISLYCDHFDDLWVGMRGGLNRISSYNTMFTQYANNNKDIAIAPNGDIHALSVDNNNYIWAGSSTYGLIKIDRNTLKTTYFTKNGSNSISDNNVRFLFKDSDGILWIGTANGLNRYDASSRIFKAYFHDNKNPASISSNYINYIAEDSKGFLWVCTNNGLNKMDRRTEKFTIFKNDPSNPNSLNNNNVSKFTEDEEGIIWIGFISSGFDRYDPKTSEFTHYEMERDNPNSLSNNRISQIHDDGRGNLWIASYGGGLDKFDKKTGHFKNYGQKQGLPNSSLYCVIEDNSGNLWLSHNEGISRFNLTTETFKNYFNGVEFNGRAYYQNTDGEILLGSVYSIVSFYPERIVDNSLVPQVHINELKLFNDVVTPQANPNIINKVIEETDTLILSHDQNFFSFGFVSLNYTNTKNNRMKYKLENFDADWVDAGNILHATYTNVPPGTYIFKVMGSNNDLVWNEEGDSIFIKIEAPLWETPLFKVGLAIGILLFLFVAYKMRLRSIQRQRDALERLVDIRTKEVQDSEKEILRQKESIASQNERLVALNHEKNELIKVVAHDLRSPLNQIKGLASIIKMINPKLNEETENSINLINDLIDRQKGMISKILDTNAIDTNSVSLNLQKVVVNDLIVEVVNSFKPVANNKSITLNTHLSTENLIIEGDENYLIQILENVISNAIKFSPQETKIEIRSEKVHGKARISVQDQGPGINQNDMGNLFKSYAQLSAKPTGNEDSTGLGLSIAKKYVETLKGTIWCESEEDRGANFIMEFSLIE